MKTKIEKLEEDIIFLVTTVLIIVVLMALFTFKNAESSEININKIIQIENYLQFLYLFLYIVHISLLKYYRQLHNLCPR